mmetsp:Transcript_44560/g.89009  ORF Transcript_44560/g.89009 Transcript_44560/m.89009 type:complete len:117 (-) Transcript_44560:64-414(-)
MIHRAPFSPEKFHVLTMARVTTDMPPRNADTRAYSTNVICHATGTILLRHSCTCTLGWCTTTEGGGRVLLPAMPKGKEVLHLFGGYGRRLEAVLLKGCKEPSAHERQLCEDGCLDI